MLRYMILGLLRGGESTHGYALWRAYERRSGRTLQSGKFYRALKSLAEPGFIQPMASPDSDPRRTPYEMTPAGRVAFDQWLIAFQAGGSPNEDEISSRALFIFDLPPDAAATFFRGAEDVLLARWKRLEHERERALCHLGTSHRDRSVQALLLARSLGRTAADLTWLRDARATYAQLHAEPQRLAPAASAPARGRTTSRAQR